MSDHVMTPIQIEVLLHHYYSPESWGDAGKEVTEAVAVALKKLTIIGLLQERTSPYGGHNITVKGQVYVEQGLLRVPLPVQVWAVPNTAA